MKANAKRLIVLSLCLPGLLLGAAALGLQPEALADSEGAAEGATEQPSIGLHYLEIVTPAVDETIATLEQANGVTFGEPIPLFGGARTAELVGGGRIGVRGPLRETEVPVVRPYLLVEDIQAAVEAAEANGGQVAIPPMPIPGEGTFAIYLLGGIEHGLWQMDAE